MIPDPRTPSINPLVSSFCANRPERGLAGSASTCDLMRDETRMARWRVGSQVEMVSIAGTRSGGSYRVARTAPTTSEEEETGDVTVSSAQRFAGPGRSGTYSNATAGSDLWSEEIGSSNHILRPRMADRTSHRSEDFVGRPALITRRHVERLEDYSDLLEEVMEDGFVDAREQRLLVIAFVPIQDDGQLINESATFADRAMHGEGVRGAWIQQTLREHVRDQSRLRLVVDNTDGPEPGAPGAAQPAKREPRDESNRQAA